MIVMSTDISKQDEDIEEYFEDSTLLANYSSSAHQFSDKHVANNSEKSFDASALNVSALCCDEELSGYDKITGKTWIYPTNYPVRDYQFNIIKSTILNNTLVSLPTGLGKTFIAAVIMYNFYRWYPLGKIVFTAPTRPLVAQQIDACYNIIAIPPNDTIEMTGHMQANSRKAHWQNKRVFFATPQVINNDIKSGICPADKIRCFVFDEAHRARGNYAYCQIMASLNEISHKTFRVLALSATPGSKVEDVINVVKNLHIARLELRSESCIDVAPYSHARKINTVVIPLGPELNKLRQQYVEILDVYARRLKQLNILPHNLGNLSKGRVVMLYKEYQTKERGARHPQHNQIMRDFTHLISLYHGLELMVKHGCRVFLNFFDEHPEKTWIEFDDKLTGLLERLRDDMGINPLSLETSLLPDGSIPEIPRNINFGHPKFERLRQIMMEHFKRCKQTGQDTRAIVFCEYRESVSLVHCLLLQCRPLILPQMFVGQGASVKDGKPAISQKHQLRVMRNFREGACNTLVATCVAEEGLDVGSVDLIICFDISNRSPIRLVQRCGRTGRERGGQVFILVTEGREHQTLNDCIRQRDTLNKRILQSKEVDNNLYKANPRMVPHYFVPECQKMYITVTKKSDSSDKKEKPKKPQRNLLNMMIERSSSSSSSDSNRSSYTGNCISKDEFDKLYPNGLDTRSYFQEPREYCMYNAAQLKSAFNEHKTGNIGVNLASWLDWQRNPQRTANVEHSADTEILSDLLKHADAKRYKTLGSTQDTDFNIPVLNVQNFPSPIKQKGPKKNKKAILTKSPLKDGDIRALFSTATKSTKSYTKVITELGVQGESNTPTWLIDLLVDLNVDNNISNECTICKSMFNCKIFSNHKKEKRQPFLKNLKLPDLSLLDDLNIHSLKKFQTNNIDEMQNCVTQTFTEDVFIENIHRHKNVSTDLKNHQASQKKLIETNMNITKNFDLELEFNSSGSSEPININDTSKNLNKNFDIGDIDDILVDSTFNVKEKSSNPKDTLDFFGLDSIDDIFADSDDCLNEKAIYNTKENSLQCSKQDSQETIVYSPPSPSILSGSCKVNKYKVSPILCSQKHKVNTKINEPFNSMPTLLKAKSLLSTTKNRQDKMPQLNSTNSLMKEANSINKSDATNSSLFTITQLVEMINKDPNYDKSHDVFKHSLVNENKYKSVTVDYNNKSNRNSSPILLSQAAKKNLTTNKRNNLSLSSTTKCQSIIILESDDDEINDLDKNSSQMNTSNKSPLRSKRKYSTDHDESIMGSPYFAKKRKICKRNNNLQDKLKVFLGKSKSGIEPNRKLDVNYMISQRENDNPWSRTDDAIFQNPFKNTMKSPKLECLQKCKRENKVLSNILNSYMAENKGRRITFDDSDEDFDFGNKIVTEKPSNNMDNSLIPTINHNKKRKPAEFLDLEAELSNASNQDSGDELSDESIGSIIDFICDEQIPSQEDMQAHYMRSVKSPVRNGAFKIPKLPNKHLNVLSQYVEEDAYEMDSFCVDSHIGLTQLNDTSELEIAEKILNRKKTKKKLRKDINYSPSPKPNTTESHVQLKVRCKKVKRRICSDSSDDSS